MVAFSYSCFIGPEIWVGDFGPNFDKNTRDTFKLGIYPRVDTVTNLLRNYHKMNAAKISVYYFHLNQHSKPFKEQNVSPYSADY